MVFDEYLTEGKKTTYFEKRDLRKDLLFNPLFFV